MKKLITIITITVFVSYMPVGASSSLTSEEYGEKSDNGSRVMAPGYINIDKQRTESMRESIAPASTTEEQIEAIGTDLGKSMHETEPDKARVELKGPKGGGTALSGNKNAAIAAALDMSDPSLHYDVAIGTGHPSPLENGRLFSEFFDGVKHIYAGFDNVGTDTIQEAISRADAGDIVIVRGDRFYYTDGDSTEFYIADGIKLYGGYDENGIRDIEATPSTIIASASGSVTIVDPSNDRPISAGPIEINGFVIQGSMDGSYGYAIAVYSPSTVTIKNNTITGIEGVWAMDYSNIIVTNNVITTHGLCLGAFGGDSSITATDNILTAYASVGSRNVVGGPLASVAFYGTDGADFYISGNTVNAVDGEFFTTTGATITDNEPTITPDTISPLTYDTSPNPWFTKGKWHTGKAFPSSLGPTMTLTLTAGDIKTSMDAGKLEGMLKGLLANKEALAPNMEGSLDPALIAKLLAETLRGSASGLISPEDMELAMMLAAILQNPTEEQKVMLDALESLLNEPKKLEEEAASPELKEARDGFTQMVAAALLAQALPDLLKGGDMANMKGLFGKLDTEKSRILLEYQTATKMYHANVVKELTSNMALLQLKGFIDKNLTEDAFAKLSASKLEEIVKNLKSAKDKTVTEQRILKVEAKYRKESLEPAKRALERNMTTLLRGFSQRIFSVLDGAELVVKQETKDGKAGLNIDLSAR